MESMSNHLPGVIMCNIGAGNRIESKLDMKFSERALGT